MTKLIKIYDNIHSYLDAESKLTANEQEAELENYSGLYLETDPYYGPKVYSPNANQVPSAFIKRCNIGHLLAGKRSKGADWYTECSSGTAVEVKYQHDNSSIGLSKLAVKDVALNTSNIKNRVLITNLSRVSAAIKELLPNWTYIFGEQIYTEEVYQRIRQHVLAPKKKTVLTECGYRPDTIMNPGSIQFHKDSIKDLFDEIVAQIGYDGVARCLSIKPTASGKSYDPILIWKHFLEKFFNKTKLLTCTVNPSLTVLAGNMTKQVKDIVARHSKTRVVVLAGDVRKGMEDPGELNLIKSQAEVVNSKSIIDVWADWMQGSYHLHIESTIHSYHTIGELLISDNVTGDFMYIDEVKHSIQDEDSEWATCLFDTCGAWTVRVGADATPVEATDEKGNQISTSMYNKDLWRNFTKPDQLAPIVWEEGDVTARGWKRKTKLEVHAYDVNNLPINLQKAVHDKKSAIIKINRILAPQEWLFALEAHARYMLNHPTRKFPMLNFNTRERVAKFIKFAEYAWPEIVKQYGDRRNSEICRLLDTPFIDIYSNGNTHNKIQRLVDGVPADYPGGATVCQVKKLSEGWDPKDGWVDGISFVDNSGSKIRIAQTIGRGQRLGGGYDNVVVYHSMIVDSQNQLEVKREFAIVSRVAEALGLGKNIDDEITFFDHTNPSVPAAGRTKGSKNLRPVWELEGGLMAAFKGFYQNGSFNPFASVVEEIFQKYHADYMTLDPNRCNPKNVKAFIESVANEYREYFNQYKNYVAKRTTFGNIMRGIHPFLPVNLKLQGRRQWKDYSDQVKTQKIDVTAQVRKEAPVLASKVLFTGQRFFNLTEVLSKKYKTTVPIVGRILREDKTFEKLQANKTHWKTIQSKALDILLDQADKSSGYKEWATNAINQFEDNGISTHNLSDIIIMKAFIRNNDGLLNKSQFAKISKLAQAVKTRGLKKVSFEKYRKEGNYNNDPYKRSRSKK